MLRLIGGTHFLVLQRNENLTTHSVFIYPRFDQAMAVCRAGFRISPIFVINKANPPDFLVGSRTWILFLGPVHPGDLYDPPCNRMFLSLGLFNVLFFSETEEMRQAVRGFADSHQIRWEEWEIQGNQLAKVHFCSGVQIHHPLPPGVANPISSAEPTRGLVPAIREYRALMLTCVTQAQIFTPDVAPDLLLFDDLFKQALQDDSITDNVAKLGSLVIANASLSRFLSQTYSGTSPILETEVHFSTHSLLGIGIASLALMRIRRFIDEAFTRTRITDLLEALHKLPAHSTPLLQSLSSTDEFWERDHLFGSGSTVGHTAIHQETKRYLPLLTFFSGRDGFRSTEFSLSAPLEAVSSCNSAPWTMQTLTHEVSHILVESVLATIVPRPDDMEGISSVIRSLQPTHAPTNLFDQLRAFVCFGIWLLKSPDQTILQETLNESELAKCMISTWSELREILTHIFDFLYFYKKNGQSYIRAVWVGWDVIPNIQHRIPDYLVRCLCALHANNLRRGKDGLQITVDQLLEYLEAAMEEFSSATYIPRAIFELKNRRSYYLKRLEKGAVLVKFVRYFLYSPTIERTLVREPVGMENDDRMTFTTKRIANPLRFLEMTSAEKKGEAQRSAWMLTQLAFTKNL